MDRGLTLRTYLWLAGSFFILAGHLSFVAYLRLGLPWWSLALMLGSLVALIVAVLEQALARPLERLTRVVVRAKDGTGAPPPGGGLSAHEIRRLWRAVRGHHDQLAQSRHAQRATETQLGQARGHVRMLATASMALRPDVPVDAVMPEVLRDMAGLLGVQDVYMVPLRRHCPVPVTGGHGQPIWAQDLRSSGLAPWEDLLAQNRPASVCLSPLAPAWREHFQGAALWVVPLVYHGKAQGLLLAPVEGQDREWTAEEWLLVQSLANVLAASLHPPRWSEERGARRQEPAEAELTVPEAGLDAPEADLDAARSEARRQERRRRRRARQGA